MAELFPLPELSFFIDLALVCVIGFILGWQREAAGKIMGERSVILLILGSFLFTYASLKVGTDHGRVVAQIVTGVGFIGAGIIFKKDDKDISNLTTAIMVWSVAAIGVFVGIGLRVEALITTALTYFILCRRHRK